MLSSTALRKEAMETLTSRTVELLTEEKLSGRQMEVLQGCLEGKDSDAIAEGLGILASTVKWHMGAILQQLQCKDRVEIHGMAFLARGNFEVAEWLLVRGVPSGKRPLTASEEEVLPLLMLGYTNERIAEELGNGVSAIKCHTQGIYRKLGISRRCELLPLAVDLALGLVPCTCEEPCGPCEGCDDEHGHTCRACDEEWCQACWLGEAHNETCAEDTREERAEAG